MIDTRSPDAQRRAISLSAAATLLAAGVATASDPGPPAVPASTEEARGTELIRSIAKQTRSPVKNEDFVLRVDGHPALGKPEAMLTLVEFSDLQCGFCRRHVNSILPVLVERYVDTGSMRYVFFDFPVDARHPAAHGAAIAARCAADQSVVQPMRQRLLASPDRLQPDQLSAHAAALGLDAARFSDCLDDVAQAEAVSRDLALGQELMVRGTPTFFVGYTRGDGTEARVLRRIVGAQPLEVFEAAIKGAVAEAQGSIAHRPSM
jgi:protein-disulfide isomerase